MLKIINNFPKISSFSNGANSNKHEEKRNNVNNVSSREVISENIKNLSNIVKSKVLTKAKKSNLIKFKKSDFEFCKS